jgi:hypothetical protein
MHPLFSFNSMTHTNKYPMFGWLVVKECSTWCHPTGIKRWKHVWSTAPDWDGCSLHPSTAAGRERTSIEDCIKPGLKRVWIPSFRLSDTIQPHFTIEVIPTPTLDCLNLHSPWWLEASSQMLKMQGTLWFQLVHTKQYRVLMRVKWKCHSSRLSKTKMYFIFPNHVQC